MTKQHKIISLASCAILLAMVYSTADAQVSLQVHGVSKHSGNYEYNEKNTGLSVLYASSDDISYQAGAYSNSYYRTTVFAAVNYTPLNFGVVRLGGFAGVGTGYDLPVMAGAAAIVEFDLVNFVIRAVPKIGDLDGVVSIEFGIKF